MILNNVYVEPRHFSPQQSYITGDVLARLLGDGWAIRQVKDVSDFGRARLYQMTFERDGVSLAVRVLDGPAVREALTRL